ncbi:hypothetical protein AAC387_Pa02g3900 [Persea americana]|eukprot:TRINITY_DN2979_c0_g1_i4.p1 TRINITY_DN2979_c0_g1~~TRINITY_DN2979_c0_g1_i4.p1  ORF type:complete len:837 (+),score=216.43 TRINITY_DN2979_c0_g1_i4:311-2821(+)
MECNRDEATRAKEIAERKFRAKDISAAKKFASKAQNLNPTLEGISQMLATFEIYLASENKISGETDWYAILGVNATADDDTVKKQYRKLALTLHPDKNKSIGAEGAFKLLSEAWSVLSDKGRRSAFDQKRNVKGSHQKVPKQNRDPSAAPNANGFYSFAKTSTNSKPPKSSRTAAPTSVPTSSRPSKTNTFWTACNQCKMQYEYLRVYLNHNLLCPNCHKPFLAVETGSPANGSNSSVTFSFPQHYRQQSASKNAHIQGRNTSTIPNVGTAGYHNQTNFQWGPFSRTAGAASATASSSAAAQAVNVVHQTYEKVRRDREALAAAKREEALRRKNHTSRRTSTGSFVGNSNAASSNLTPERPAKKRRGIDDNGGSNYGRDEVEETGFKAQTTGRHINANTGGSETEKVNGVSKDYLVTRNILIEKARTMICKKLEEWNSVAASKVAVKEIEKEKEATPVPNAKVSNENKSATEPANEKKHVVINVPDPDFHDFDKDRTEKCFDANQVWAAYDDDDGMPRFYALIQKVISYEPFKMRFSWLNSKTNSELGPINWVASGFTKTCGEFRVGRYEVNDTVNVFSHRVRWEKGVRGVVKITPRRGDVWALYRNWSPNWNETTLDYVVHKYDMVEVLDDYNEEHGVSVTPLVKVAGYKTVFHRHMDPAQVRRIPREEMFRFSHQVPSWLLSGEEAENAPKGCRELDPAATPLELLQIITETREDKVVESSESVQEAKDSKMETAENTYDTKQDEVVEMAEQIQVTKEDVMMETVEVVEQIQETKKDTVIETGEQKQDGKEDVVIQSAKQMKETKEDFLTDAMEKINETNGVATARTSEEQLVS